MPPATALRSPSSRSPAPGVVLNLTDYPDYVLVPRAKWNQLHAESLAAKAIRTLEDPDTKWVDVQSVGKQLAAQKIIAARKSRRLTQAQLGKLVGVPQSQISRLERHPESATINFLRRVAKALKVKVSDLV